LLKEGDAEGFFCRGFLGGENITSDQSYPQFTFVIHRKQGGYPQTKAWLCG
jgi:hypothetical protein